MNATASAPWDATPRARRRFAVALGVSLAAHGAAWHWTHLPAVKVDRPEHAIEVAIVTRPAPPALQTAPVEEIAAPKPPPPQALPRPRKAPQPRITAAPAPVPPTASVETPARDTVIAAKPDTSPPADFAVPPPPAPPVAKLIEPQTPSHEALAGYGRSVSQALARHRDYPRLALMRGWQGSTTLRLRVAPGGRLADAAVHQSSGYEVLDDQALAMVRRLGSLPSPPDALRDREFAVLVPVVFQLAK